ncbi:DUF6311 domain-containing protein [Sphingomonas sp. GlSt437]|uniref:DUF6311 domain-containing protein n=1 Tax=Sphingomonas sp. GlSt437 TaxID=3389970 RepID=UPI003A843F4E
MKPVFDLKAAAPLGRRQGVTARLITPLLLLVLPLAFFLSLFSWQVLDIGNAGWLLRGTDNGENALGAHAYWHDPTTGASLRNSLLNAPDGEPVLFTDSNPLLTLLAKPFAAWLPADAQLVGPFILATLILQAFFAWLLLRRHAPGPIALWAGVALLAFPPTLANRFMHANLMAHWTILAALWLFLDPVRRAKLRWWAPLIAITAMIHSYLLVMVGAIWASAMLASFVEARGRDRVALIGHGVTILAIVALLARWMGVEGQRSTGSLGRFAMPIDALWNPGIAGFSRLMPTSAGHTWFEGFQYLGAGGLVLMIAAVAIAWRRPMAGEERTVLTRLRWLAPALIVLATVALLRQPLPAALTALLDPVRASGRLFWPMAYTLVLLALLAVYRLSAERAGMLLISLIALQVFDLGGMAATIRQQSADAANHRLYEHTPDPRWDQLIAQSNSIAFMSGDVGFDLQLYQEVTWRAIKAGRPVNTAYAARAGTATIQRLQAEAEALEQGRLVPGRLYILINQTKLPAAVATTAGARILHIDGRTVIAPR